MLGLAIHGQAEAIDKSIYKKEWMETDLSRNLLDATISLARDGKQINAVSIISRAKLSVPGLLQEMIYICNNGFGQADLKDAIDHSYQIYINHQAEMIADEMKRLSQMDPRNARQWLVTQASKIGSLVRDGDSYDPRPSVLAEGQLPTLFAKSLITGMDDILRGGYRYAYFVILAGITKHGKSMTLQSQAIDLALQKFKVTFVTTENDPAIVSAQLASALSGIDFMKEVVPGVFIGTDRESPEERKVRYKKTLQYLDEYIKVYPISYCNDEALKRLVKWNKPNAVILDYLKKIPNLLSKRTNTQDEIGDFADWLLTFSHKEGIWLGTAGQISNDMSAKLMRKDTGDPVILYGTARVGMAADEFIFLKRHPKKKDPPHAYFRVQLDRFFGRLDTVHEETPIDIKRRILEIKRLKAYDDIGFDF